MNIKELLYKLFKVKVKSLALPTDLESIPMRDKLNADKILVLDNYKNKYLESISHKKIITSHDITSHNFNNEMLMNFNLFGRLVIKHNDIYNFDTMEDYEKDKLWIKQRITPTKIKLYIDRMEEMYNETHLRLIALKEIYQEIGITLSKNKRSAILNEIYNLTSSYIILKNNFLASLVEMKTYKNELYVTPDITETAGKRLLSEYEKELLNYVSLFIPDKIKQLESNNDIEYRIAYLERELEIYTYNNLKIDDLNKELEELDKITKTKDNKFKILDKLHLLELKYKMLSNYGENELDLKPLYEVKFDALTFDINDIDYNPFKEFILKKDLKHYEDIIFEKINTYITGKDSILNNQLDESEKDIINCFVNILKDNDQYDYQDILMDKMKLALLLSVPSIDKMIYFFENTKIDLKYNDILKQYLKGYDYIFNTDEVISFSTICRIFPLPSNIYYDLFEIIDDYVKIYNYYHQKHLLIDANVYKFPEGITTININPNSILAHYKLDDSSIMNFSSIINYFANKINDKTMIMPSSLKEIDLGDNPYHIHASVPKIILNDGLKSFKGDILYLFDNIESITIPSSLEKISFYNYLDTDNPQFDKLYLYNQQIPEYSDFKSYYTFQEIIFDNFEDSIILHNSVGENIFSAIFMMLLTRCMFDDSNYMIYSLASILDMKIILRSKDNTEYVINASEIFTNIFKDINIDNNFYPIDKLSTKRIIDIRNIFIRKVELSVKEIVNRQGKKYVKEKN